MITSACTHHVSGNVNFSSSSLYVDAINSRVGIGTSSPDTTFKVSGSANITGATVLSNTLNVVGAVSLSNALSVSGNTTLSNAFITAISANGSFGGSGQFLTSNSTGIYWSALSGGSIGGTNTQVQFNDSGSFGATAGFTFNKTTKINKKTGDKKHGSAPLDAQILGGFRMSEIEGIHYPFSSIEKISSVTDISDVLENIVSVKEIMSKRASQAVAEQMLADIKSGKMMTPSMKSLKDYRTAMAIRKKYESRGIGYVLFAHPRGLNIDNPRTYDKTANQRAKVEDVLKKNISAEILNAVKKYVSDFKKSRES
jgi:hypothetical protein